VSFKTLSLYATLAMAVVATQTACADQVEGQKSQPKQPSVQYHRPPPPVATKRRQAADELNRSIERFLGKVDVGHNEVLGLFVEKANTLSFKMALCERLDSIKPELRAQMLKQAFDNYIRSLFLVKNGRFTPMPDQQDFSGTLKRNLERYESDLRRLRPLLNQISRDLPDQPPFSGRLKQVLQREGAAESVYVAFVMPLVYPHPLPEQIASLFTMGDDGRYVLAADKRQQAGQLMEKARPAIEAYEKIWQNNRAVASQIAASDKLHKRFKQALAEPTFAATVVLEQLRNNPSVNLKKLVDQVDQAIHGNFETRQGLFYLQPGTDRQKLHRTLDRYELVRDRLGPTRYQLRSFTAQLRSDDPALNLWRRYLASEVTVLALGQKQDAPRADAVQVFLQNTRLGRALNQAPKDRWRVNPYKRADAQLMTGRLEQLIADHVALRSTWDQFIAGLDDDSIAALFRDPLTRYSFTATLSRQIDRNPPDVFQYWVGRYFEQTASGYQLLPQSETELQALLARAGQLQDQLAQENPPFSIGLDALPYRLNHVEMFRSSVFYNPRTATGVKIYNEEFQSHHTARLYGLFEWHLLSCQDVPSYLQRLRGEQQRLDALSRTHDNFIVMLNYMPDWLSRSRDQTPVEGDFKRCNGYRPANKQAWIELVQGTVKFMNQFKNVNIYYEIWNEPDIGYWQEDTDAFLELYEMTAKAIQVVAPQAKIGGTGVNQWNGKAKRSANRDPINVELIRYAKQRNLPLDFISWHEFNGDPASVKRNKAYFEKALRQNGYTKMPEFIVSEWNVSAKLKGSPYAAAAFAEQMLAFYQAGIDIQTYAAWEEFNRRPGPGGYGPYGMITQQGVKKPQYYVHQFFDQLAQNTQGVAVVESSTPGTKAIVSKKGHRVYELLCWEAGYNPALLAAIKHLRKRGLTKEQLLKYGDPNDLEDAIRQAKPLDRSHGSVLRQAKQIYSGHPARQNLMHLTFTGANRVEVLDARSVKKEDGVKPVFTDGNTLTCQLDKYEVLWLKVRVD